VLSGNWAVFVIVTFSVEKKGLVFIFIFGGMGGVGHDSIGLFPTRSYFVASN
jgi:hypothetical protein